VIVSAAVRNPERIVESGYDKIHQIYHELRAQRFWTNESEIRSFARRLPEGGMVLDAGSGSGFVASMLEKRGFRVTGIDLSRKMLRLARRNAPKSRFRRLNMRTLSFPADTFDGIICMYAIIHVPRRFHRGIIEGFHRTLKPMGILAIHKGWGD
jgi:2-polyprenyl-3-methyl-5-hydroxy-6-metoxy-1,4-benzoquinol methylase